MKERAAGLVRAAEFVFSGRLGSSALMVGKVVEGKRTTSAADWPLRLVTERALDGINEMVRLEEHADRVVLHLGIGQQSARRGEWIPSDGDPFP